VCNMMNRKEKTSQKSAGFLDPDLMTDDHDAIMIWLDKNIVDVMIDIGFAGVMTKTWEKPIIKGHGQYATITGYIDMHVTSRVEDADGYHRDIGIAFEVKSRISNIGEVIRQINQYKTFSRFDHFYIVSPDDRFVDILKSQSIGFIKSPRGIAP
jgi:hypothetical protein